MSDSTAGILAGWGVKWAFTIAPVVTVLAVMWLVSDDVAGLTAQVFRNVEVLLRAAGASLDDIVSCLVHLSDLAQFAEFNASYAKQFPGPVKPVRTTVGSDLAAGMRVEVTVVARRPGRAASAVTPAGR